jgi:hypothetical protein
MEAITKGICPMCWGERVVWKAITGSSAWCSCCGGTGVYPPPSDSHGDGLYEIDAETDDNRYKVTLQKRESRYRVRVDTPDEAVEKARQKLKDTAANPNHNDGDWSSLNNALGHMHQHQQPPGE